MKNILKYCNIRRTMKRVFLKKLYNIVFLLVRDFLTAIVCRSFIFYHQKCLEDETLQIQGNKCHLIFKAFNSEYIALVFRLLSISGDQKFPPKWKMQIKILTFVFLTQIRKLLLLWEHFRGLLFNKTVEKLIIL